LKFRGFSLLLLLVLALSLASCGGTGGSGGSQQGNSGGDMQGMGRGQGSGERTGGMSGMMKGMDHGSMNMGSGGMARQMVMENGKYSDKAFIDAMVPHHQGAIEMAKVAQKNAEHEQIKELSRNIISTQQAEIEELKSIKKEEFGTSRVPMEMGSGEMKMMGMTDPDELANKHPFDKAFIDAMIPHHQSAIEMAKVAYEKSKNSRIRELANNIIDAQNREIAQMQQWRRDWYPEG
jgi:uncharacterized protein (DUF305 family)